jgi:hypothetical protein
MSDELDAAIAWAEDLDAHIWPHQYNHKYLRILIAAARAQVPRQPTFEMLDAAANRPGYGHGISFPDIWRAMYDAAPKSMAATPTEPDATPAEAVVATRSGATAGETATPHAADDALAKPTRGGGPRRDYPPTAFGGG